MNERFFDKTTIVLLALIIFCAGFGLGAYLQRTHPLKSEYTLELSESWVVGGPYWKSLLQDKGGEITGWSEDATIATVKWTQDGLPKMSVFFVRSRFVK